MQDDHDEYDYFSAAENGKNEWHDATPSFGSNGLFSNLQDLWQWDGLAAEVGQESQARIALVGLQGAGKSLLFNRLRGWVISGKEEFELSFDDEFGEPLQIESLGLFVLADLPVQTSPNQLDPHQLTLSLSDPALILYIVDGEKGVTAADYRWIASLRVTGKPLIVALNKSDLLEDVPTAVSQASERLGVPIIPISAENGENVDTQLLMAMLDAVPRLAVPLGRELRGLRRHAARRVIRQSALLAGVVGAQPIPLLDLPFQVMIQVGMVMRISAAYGLVPTGSVNREVVGTVIGTLGVRYLALALVKFIPVVGSVVAGALSGLMTFVIGEAAIRYYEAGATIPLQRLIVFPRQRLGQARRRMKNWIPRKKYVRAQPATTDNEEDEIIEVIHVEEK